MNRNISAFVLIIAANIVILAHAFTPHNYQNDHFCFRIHECNGYSHDSHESSADQNLPLKACCFLADIHILPPDNTRHDLSSFVCKVLKSFHYPEFVMEAEAGFIPFLIGLSFRQNPICILFLVDTAGFIPGLRAPPLC